MFKCFDSYIDLKEANLEILSLVTEIAELSLFKLSSSFENFGFFIS